MRCRSLAQVVQTGEEARSSPALLIRVSPEIRYSARVNPHTPITGEENLDSSCTIRHSDSSTLPSKSLQSICVGWYATLTPPADGIRLFDLKFPAVLLRFGPRWFPCGEPAHVWSPAGSPTLGHSAVG